MATKKTVIRSSKQHAVKLSEGGQLAQGQQAHVGTSAAIPPSIGKSTAGKRVADAAKKGAPPPAKTKAAEASKSPSTAPAAPTKRSAPAPRQRSKPAAADTPALRPRLPAWVPVDSLWEADSVVMQRLQALTLRNAQLAEQMQRIQNISLSKGQQT